MQIVNDSKLKDKFIKQFKITEIFTGDIKPLLELLYFKKNDYICKENEEIEYLHFFVKGKAKTYTTLSNGKSLLLCFYDDFRVIGDMEIINLQTASTNVIVIEETYCISISLQNVKKYLLNDARFLRYICSSLSEKLNRSSTNSSINLLYPLENRLASFILATGESIFKNDKKTIEFHENLTEISELLGTSYRHLLRTLNGLCLKGIIIKNDNYFEVINEMKLKELAADVYK